MTHDEISVAVHTEQKASRRRAILAADVSAAE